MERQIPNKYPNPLSRFQFLQNEAIQMAPYYILYLETMGAHYWLYPEEKTFWWYTVYCKYYAQTRG
jgi:hypothetical protein